MGARCCEALEEEGKPRRPEGGAGHHWTDGSACYTCVSAHRSRAHRWRKPPAARLIGGALALAVINLADDVLGALAVHPAADRDGRSQDLLDGAGELLGARPGAHDAGNLNDVVKADVPGVLNVLLLLPVPRRLLKCLNDQSGCRGDDGGRRLPVLHCELHSHTQPLPFLSGGLGNILSDLLGGQTQRTDLWGQRGGSADLATSGADIHLNDGVGVELGSHLGPF
mmetsp:Transcript_16117/g.44917  ORF Transcript_16117/g.44917 Transcript_16117/m.44917 type:complete len:225 (-) Transcript_16117:80-754(-)